MFRLTEGLVGALADEFALVGAVFAAHAKARAEVLNPTAASAPQAAAPATASPASPANAAASPDAANAIERFRKAVAAASANGAGRVAAASPG